MLGSGDLFTAQACLDMIEFTGVDGVTVARGAIGNPWIFAQVRALAAGEPLPDPPTLHEQRDVIPEHYRLAEELYGPERCLPDMRKFAIKYSQLHPQHAEVRADFCQVKQPGAWRDVLDKVVRGRRPGRAPGDRRAESAFERSGAAGRQLALPELGKPNQRLPTLGFSAFFSSPAVGDAAGWGIGCFAMAVRRRVGVQEPRPIAVELAHAVGELRLFPALCRPS